MLHKLSVPGWEGIQKGAHNFRHYSDIGFFGVENKVV